MNRVTVANAGACHAMALTVETLLQLDDAKVEIECGGPSEWRTVWHRQHPREQLVLGTFYDERAADARAALIALVRGTLSASQ